MEFTVEIKRAFARKPIIVKKKYFSKKECEDIQDKMDPALSDLLFLEDTADVKGVIKARTFILNSDSKATQACQDKLFKGMMHYNDKNYHIPKLYASDGAYISEYEKGGFRGLHIDGGYLQSYGYYNKIQQSRFFNRQLTGVVQLTNPDEYKGGSLQIPGFDMPEGANEQGSLIIFPSSFLHEVKKVTWGYRYSLVGFLYSDAFNGK